MPTWAQLLENFYPNLKLDDAFYYYLSKCNNDLAVVAKLLADDFHHIWWRNDEFIDSRSKFKDAAKTSKQFPFKLEISEYLKRLSRREKKYDNEIQLFGEAIIEGIITTNWDDFLESTFSDFKVYVGQQELLFSESISVGEIYKIHGSCFDPKSLVVTSEDYLDFNSRNPYLAAKMLTIFVEHPILFLGYSISDPNIIEIIDSIFKCLNNDNISKLKDRLIFVEWHENADPQMVDSNLVLKDGNVLPIKLVKLDSFSPLFSCLKKLKKRLPVKVLRRLKESVYEFVKTANPTDKLYIGDLNNLDENSKIDFVVGVGIAKQMMSIHGYKGVEANDIIEDVIFDKNIYDAEIVLTDVFPKIARGSTYMPICKYLSEANCYEPNHTLNQKGSTLVNSGKIKFRANMMPDCFMPPASYKNKGSNYKRQYQTLQNMLANLDKEHSLIFIPFLERNNIDLDLLKTFLQNIYREGKLLNTNFRKIVCLYDFYKFGS